MKLLSHFLLLLAAGLALSSCGTTSGSGSFERLTIPVTRVASQQDSHRLGQEYGRMDASKWKSRSPYRHRDYLRLPASMWSSFVFGYRVGYQDQMSTQPLFHTN